MLSNGVADDACMDRERAKVIMQRIEDLESLWTLDEFFAGWFRGAAPGAVCRGNALDFTAYGFFAAKWDDLPADVRPPRPSLSLC